MAAPLYDCAMRTSVTAAGGAMIQLVPPAAALATGRMVRVRLVTISNTTATAFPVGLGIATAAAVTPATAGTIMRRNAGLDPASVSNVWTTFATTPTAPTGFNARFTVPGNSAYSWGFNEGEELIVPPASTPLPFCVFVPSGGTGQVADITLTWSE